MIRPLLRFMAAGAIATAVDIGVFAMLARAGGATVVADVAALAAAALFSWRLHRAVAVGDDPLGRGYRRPGAFFRVAVLAGLLDVVVLVAVLDDPGEASIARLVGAKAVAVAAAALVRSALWRSVLYPTVRDDQARLVDRGASGGDRRASVVVPAFNEAARMGTTISALRQALEPLGDVEIVVVDDGSGDATAQAATDAGADTVISLPENRGKGAAVRAGMLAARGRSVAFTDADLSYPPAQLLRLFEQVEAGFDVVVGSRRHVETTTLVRARRLREIAGRLFNLVTVLVLLGHYRDTQCGLKAFRGDAARILFGAGRIDRFAFDVELFHLAERFRLTLVEVPVELSSSETSTVRVVRDAARMLRDVLRIRFLAASGAYPAEVPADRWERGASH